MFKKLAFLGVAVSMLSACSITQNVEPAELVSGKQLCIVENSDVREGFLTELRASLDARGIQHQVVNEKAIPAGCEWTAQYRAHWNWDLALYMSYAEIKIYRNGNLDGEAVYDSRRGGGNMAKFIDAETKIRELVDELIQIKSASLFGRYFG